jgi:predicted transcriptional regulator
MKETERNESEVITKPSKDIEHIERAIVAGLIHSNQFCEEIRADYGREYLEARSAAEASAWCMSYFDKFKEAPGGSINDIYYDKKKAGEIPSDMVEEIEEDLESLLGEPPPENVPFLVERTRKYFEERRLEIHLEKVETLLSQGDLKQAQELAAEFTPVNGTIKTSLENLLQTSTEFITKDIPPPRYLLRPWLTEQSLTMIYGPRGAGKTWLAAIIGVLLTRKPSKGEALPDVGPWSVTNSAGVLLIDGEMTNYMLQERFRELCENLPKEDPENPLQILTAHDFTTKNESQLQLDGPTRAAIYTMLKERPEIRVLILDNISSLTPGIIESTKEDWDPINQWLISLKHLGCSVVFVHHANKDGKQRGTSGREDSVDTVINVALHKNYDQNTDNAWFTVKYEKSRNLRPGDSKKEFSLRIVDGDSGGLIWEQDEEGQHGETRRQIITEILEGEKQADIARSYDVSAGRVSQLKKEAIAEGLLREVKKKGGGKVQVLTDKGRDFIGD